MASGWQWKIMVKGSCRKTCAGSGEKGFTGSSHRNGQYKSTGMGLYMVSQILKRLEHQIEVESQPGSYTRFTITFVITADFFHL